MLFKQLLYIVPETYNMLLIVPQASKAPQAGKAPQASKAPQGSQASQASKAP